jgi:hypothetical protein
MPVKKKPISKSKPRQKKQDNPRGGKTQIPNHKQGEVSNQSGTYECNKSLLDGSKVEAAYQSGILRITVQFVDEYSMTLTHICFLERIEDLPAIIDKLNAYTDIVDIDGAYLLKYKNVRGVNINLVTREVKNYDGDDRMLVCWMRGEQLEHLLQMGVTKQKR